MGLFICYGQPSKYFIYIQQNEILLHLDNVYELYRVGLILTPISHGILKRSCKTEQISNWTVVVVRNIEPGMPYFENVSDNS